MDLEHFGYIYEIFGSGAFGISDQDIGDVITCITRICISSRLLKEQRSLLSVITKYRDIILSAQRDLMDNMKSVSEAKCFLRCFPLFEGCFEVVREKLLLLFFLPVTPHALLMVKTC